MPGKFLVFDGIDGCGKTTQLLRSASYLYQQSKANRVLLTREPTMEKHGLALRQKLSRETSTKSTEEIISLFVADRVHHYDTVIRPALERGHFVLCDRHKYSTVAYQAAGGWDVSDLVSRFRELPAPDLALVFDLDASSAMVRNRGDDAPAHKKPVHGLSLFERPDFLADAASHFTAMPRYFPRERVRLVDAAPAPDAVFSAVSRELEAL